MVLSVLGIVNASYLFWKHRQKKPLVCPLDHDCSVVTESKWSNIFGIRNEIIGGLFFLLLLVGVFVALLVPMLEAMIFLIFLISAGGALLFSLFLVFIQKYVIKDYCFYCLLSALITLLLFLNSILLNFG